MNFFLDSTKLDVVAHRSIATTLEKYQYNPSIFIDATAGNGCDTSFLAQLAGKDGFVLAFDIQQQALEHTYQRLKSAGLSCRVTLINTGHENLYNEFLSFLQHTIYTQDTYSQKRIDMCSAIMFNLGFLPRSNEQIITHTETTLKALNNAIQVLSLGGILSIHCYTGHLGGAEEGEAVLDWANKLSQKWNVEVYLKKYKPKNNEHLVLIRRIQS